MDVREKLVELLADSVYENVELDDGYVGYEVNNEQIADYLIAHGVTVQEWISVKDKYPNHGDVVLICTKDKDIHAFQWDAVYDGWVGDRYNFSKRMVTHWMPLPEPPKEEE